VELFIKFKFFIIICRFRNSEDVVSSLSVDPLYLRHDSQSSAIDLYLEILSRIDNIRAIKLGR